MTPTKLCFKCHKRKPLTGFYRHPAMADGHLGKCIECTKADVKRNYADKRQAKHEYDKLRYGRPKRRAAMRRYQVARRARNPEKYKAHRAVGDAVRGGRLVRGPCGVCGANKKIQGHHADYSRPLDVEWLCFRCHRERRHGQVTSAAAA